MIGKDQRFANGVDEGIGKEMLSNLVVILIYTTFFERNLAACLLAISLLLFWKSTPTCAQLYIYVYMCVCVSDIH